MMARKVDVCIENWEFHLVTPPKCQKLPSSITKTAHVKFQATLGSLPTTLSLPYPINDGITLKKRHEVVQEARRRQQLHHQTSQHVALLTRLGHHQG
jgi:hypothetical protein